MGVNDCGIATIVQTGHRVARVTFAPDGGAAKPTIADATDHTKYTTYSVPSSTLAVQTASRVSDYVYDLLFDGELVGGSAYTINTSAIATDLGGYCDSPEVGSFTAASYNATVNAVSFPAPRTIDVEFGKEAGAGTPLPLEYYAEIAASYVVTSALSSAGLFTGGRTGGLLEVLTATVVQATYPAKYRLVVSRAILPGEEIAVATHNLPTTRGGTCTGTATGVVPGTGVDYDHREGMLEATTAAYASLMAEIMGRPATRLRVPLAMDETDEVGVESTLNWPETGALLVRGERITYTERNPDGFRGITRESNPEGLYAENGLQPWPVDTEVELADDPWASVAASAKGDLSISRANGIGLERLANDLGVPKPLAQMSDDDLREYVAARVWRGMVTPQAVYSVLRPMFRWAEVGDTGMGVTVDGLVWLPLADVTNSDSLYDRLIEVDGSLCRIVATATDDDYALVLLDTVGGALHAGITLVDGTSYAWSLLAFRCNMPGGVAVDGAGAEGAAIKAARVDVHLYPGMTDVPYTYMLDSGEAGDDRPRAGITLENASSPSIEDDPTSPNFGEWKAPFFFLDPFATAVEAVLSDVFAAGILVRVTTRD